MGSEQCFPLPPLLIPYNFDITCYFTRFPLIAPSFLQRTFHFYMLKSLSPPQRLQALNRVRLHRGQHHQAKHDGQNTN